MRFLWMLMLKQEIQKLRNTEIPREIHKESGKQHVIGAISGRFTFALRKLSADHAKQDIDTETCGMESSGAERDEK